MLRVTVNVRKADEILGQDIEVPAEIPVGQLTEMIAQGLGWNKDNPKDPVFYEVTAEPSGRGVQPHETLAEAELWDGTHLVFKRIHKTHEHSPEPMSMACLRSRSGQSYLLDHSETVIGRGALGLDLLPGTGHINLGNEPTGRTVSRDHAHIVFDGTQWFLIPSAGALNETTVNAESVESGERRCLSDGDSLQFGGVLLEFHLVTPDPRDPCSV